MNRFRNRSRAPYLRANWWDYGWNGAYFITICTKDKAHFFGHVHNEVMQLSRLGVAVDILWNEIPNHSKNVELGDYVVMPNHFHGILILDNPSAPSERPTTTQNRFQNIGKNTVSSIIGSFKSAVSKHANRVGLKNGWQPRFYDRIIHDAVAYQRISEYIINNPANWHKDKFYSSPPSPSPSP